LGVTGSIAAYKAAMLARLLVKEGAEVHVLLSEAAHHFVGPATFAGITGRPIATDMFSPLAGGESHVTLASRSDLIVIAPATADTLSRLAAGRADDGITAAVLCARCPVLVAPAMHPNMWSHPATQRNVAELTRQGRVERVGPVAGEVASGDVGEGRFVDPEVLLERVVARLGESTALAGHHLVITAGPTQEALDPVRYLTNRSSGKMGYALAERAAARGARVTLVSGPVSLATPAGVQRVNVDSALAMQATLAELLRGQPGVSAIVMAAAVADYRPRELSATKLKKSASTATLELVKNPDLLGELGAARHDSAPVLVGFALETGTDGEVLAYAQRKLAEKRVDLIVANAAESALEGDTTRAALVRATGSSDFIASSKRELAERILDEVAQLLQGGTQ
jgi:phosphopantothenoylcysteine decarboxylase/phosphopantothenate--cysteine ligase